MSIEKALADLTAALEANTAALKAAGSAGAAAPAAAPEKTPRGKKNTEAEAPAKKTGPTHTREEMVAALNDVKEKKGLQDAKSIITDVGGVTKMADIPDDKIDAVYEKAKSVLGAAEEEEPM